MTRLNPWYKQFWPWFLIILPAVVVIASIVTLVIAINHADPLIAEEYYKDGKAINQDLAKNQQAKILGINFLLVIKNNQFILTQHGGTQINTPLQISFFHPTLAMQDFSFLSQPNNQGHYQFNLPHFNFGKWEVRIENPLKTWRIHHKLTINNDKKYWLN